MRQIEILIEISLCAIERDKMIFKLHYDKTKGNLTMTKTIKAAKSVTIIMTFTLASKFLGFFREMLIVNKFGAGEGTDAFFVAMTVTALLVGIIEVGVNTTLIPVLAEIESKEGTYIQWISNLCNTLDRVTS